MKRYLLSIFIIIIFFNIFNFSYADEIEEQTDYIWLDEEIKNVSINNKAELLLNAKNICALDRNSKKVIFEKNKDIRVPMASTTKIMTAIVLVENLNKDKIHLNTKVKVGKEAANIQGSRLGLKKGDEITINDLLYGLMLCSR